MKQQNLLLLFIMQVLFGCSSELIDANGKILQKYSTNNIVCEIDTIEKEMDIRFYEDSIHTGFFTVLDFNLERKLVGVRVNYPNFTKYFNYYPRRREYDVRIKFGRKKRLQQLLIFDENLKLIEDYGIYIKRFNLQGANYFQLKMTNVLLDSPRCLQQIINRFCRVLLGRRFVKSRQNHNRNGTVRRKYYLYFMSRYYKYHNSCGIYFVSFVVVF